MKWNSNGYFDDGFRQLYLKNGSLQEDQDAAAETLLIVRRQFMASAYTSQWLITVYFRLPNKSNNNVNEYVQVQFPAVYSFSKETAR